MKYKKFISSSLPYIRILLFPSSQREAIWLFRSDDTTGPGQIQAARRTAGVFRQRRFPGRDKSNFPLTNRTPFCILGVKRRRKGLVRSLTGVREGPDGARPRKVGAEVTLEPRL